MMPFVLAIFLMAPLPAPTQIQPSPTPMVSATATPTRSSILGGVTLGEDSQRVLREFGLRPRGWASGGHGGIEIRIFPTGYGDITMTIMFDDAIHAIFVEGTSDPKSQYSDPFGLHVGDSIDRLEQVRGQPDILNKNGEELQYGPTKGVNWSYGVKDDKIVQIALGDGT
jgi:hypothetical protein